MTKVCKPAMLGLRYSSTSLGDKHDAKWRSLELLFKHLSDYLHFHTSYAKILILCHTLLLKYLYTAVKRILY